MKIIKGLAISLFLATLFGSCFDPPEYPPTPKISFQYPSLSKNLEYYAPDSLVIHITFRDGDGDLGIDANSSEFISAPFHYQHYFITNNGKLDSLGTILENDTIEVIDIPNPNVGKLATIRTRKNPLYNNAWGGSPIPPMPAPSHCDRYPYTVVGKKVNRFIYVAAEDTAALEAPTSTLKKIMWGSTTYYAVEDTLLIKYNQNYYNFDAELLVEDPPNSNNFFVYDWATRDCSTIDGRFPYLSETSRTLEGDLTYSMENQGLNAFLGKNLQLRVQITDRALHKSNVIQTNTFQLDKIRRNQ